MRSREPKPGDDLAQNWICESCGTVHIGVNPPDACSWCEHTYFDNLQDLCDMGVEISA